MLKIDEHYNALISKISLPLSKVRPYEGFIFLCGGELDITELAPTSVRDAIYRELSKDKNTLSRVHVAENFKDWNQDSIYRDLLVFEKNLAELSSLIVLILEGEGSIAELGLFSIIQEFQKKLLVVIDTSHYEADSFIKHGPISFLEGTHNNQASCHRWLKKIPGNGKATFDPQLATEISEDLAEEILDRLTAPTKEISFDKNIWLHVALLTCDLLNLFSALTLGQIKDFLTNMGINKTESEIIQIVFLLERTGLLKKEPKGSQRFYIAIRDSLFLKFHLTDRNFDFDRLRLDILESHKKYDKKRFKVIQEIRAKTDAK